MQASNLDLRRAVARLPGIQMVWNSGTRRLPAALHRSGQIWRTCGWPYRACDYEVSIGGAISSTGGRWQACAGDQLPHSHHLGSRGEGRARSGVPVSTVCMARQTLIIGHIRASWGSDLLRGISAEHPYRDVAGWPPGRLVAWEGSRGWVARLAGEDRCDDI